MLRVLPHPATRVLTGVAMVSSMAAWLFFLPGGRPLPYRIDFDVYRTGAQLLLDGGYIYGELPELAQGGHLPFTYPPIAAVLFTVFTVIPLWLGSLLLTLASMACLWWLCRILERQAPIAPLFPDGTTGRDVALFLLIAYTVGLWFAPVRETFGYGQINIILTALVLADVSAKEPRWWTGALVGLAVAIKLTPAVFLLFFFLKADWRSMLRAALSFLVFTGIGHLVAPEASYRYWTEVLIDTGRIGGVAYASNQSINGALARFGLEGASLTIAWFVTALAAGLLVAWSAWRLLRHGQQLAAAVVVGFAALLCSPVSWGHHWIWAWVLVVLLVVWATSADSGRAWAWLAVSGAAVFLASPHWWWPRENQAELDWRWYQHLTGDAYLLWSLVAIVALGVLAPRVPGSEPQASVLSPPGSVGYK
ncbi:MAG TPA: glycosyltransferase 87 family protein [Arachnia sp.]|nr:glycosyltransferase 87 family protein [Arachnia sp.]HMT86747.1 glycosyltransferase 87 family protein [Arachnia sp.]